MVLNEQQRRKLAYYAKVELANRSYEDYFKLANSAHVPPAEIFPHTHYICEHLQKIVDGERRFYIVEMPPQTGKSMTITETFPSYYLIKNPDKHVMLAAYSDSLTKGFGIKNLTKFNDLAGDMDNLALSKRKHTANEWNIEGHQGGMFATTVLGQSTGKPADLLIIDDPFSGMVAADSSTMRDKVWETFTGNFLARISANASIIVIMTRWNVDDLSGRLLKQNALPWEELRVPAIAEEDDPIGRKVGDPILPQLGKNKKFYKQMLDVSGNRVFSAEYQQRPVKQGGNIFKESNLQYYVQSTDKEREYGELDNPNVSIIPDHFDKVWSSWDLTFTSSEMSDYVAGQTWAKKGSSLYLIDRVHARMEFPDQVRAIKAMAARHPEATKVIIEKKANGAAAITELQSQISGIQAVVPTRDKVARADAILGYWDARNIFIPHPKDAPWVNKMIDEWIGFPNMQHDDEVDAMTQALQYGPSTVKAGISMFDISL